MSAGRRRFSPSTFVLILAGLGLLRLISLGTYPLADTTEARYAEIARLMATTGNWVTPQIEAGVPFWAKPPLSTWASAASFKLFGINEFAARLPSFLFAIVVLALVFSWVKQMKGTACALAAAVVLSTTAVFFISSGAVMTDPSLLLGTTLSMVAFYRAVTRQAGHSTLWSYAFFVGLAISLLAKGPIGIVLTFFPIGLWVIARRNWRQVWQRMPWVKGMLLTAALSLPWYLWAEHRTPGFLEYFLVGEHWKRFMQPGWQGDMYGSAHSWPRGSIWMFWLVASLPWSFIAIGALFFRKGRHKAAEAFQLDRSLNGYLLSWSVAPMIFFTLAGNILWTYILPGLPAFAILVSTTWLHNAAGQAMKPGTDQVPILRIPGFSSVAVGMLVLFTTILLTMTSDIVPHRKCQKELISSFRHLSSENARLTYLFNRPYSAQFYSRGRSVLIKDPAPALFALKDSQPDFYAVRKSRLSQLPDDLAVSLENIGEFNGYILLREKRPETGHRG